MNEHVDINKFRKFSLLIGLILIIYAISVIQIDTTEKIRIFGCSFILKRQDLIGIALVIVSTYCVIRYYIYGIVIGLHPKAARKHLLNGTLANGNNYAENIETFRVLARQDIEKYFPILESPHDIKWTIEAIDNHYQINLELSRLAKIFCKIHELDFDLPIILNVIAIILFFVI